VSKNKEILGLLLSTIENRDGVRRVQQIQVAIKKQTFAALDREAICQIVSLERPGRRFLFLLLCPQLIVPYLFRIRESPKATQSP
jgi:hypothetical protein